MLKALINVYRWVFTIIGMILFGLIGGLLLILSFGLLRNFLNSYFFAPGARFLLILFGYHYDPLPRSIFPQNQVVYVINHNSYLDIFMLSGLGLKNTRYVISEVIFKFPHMVLVSKVLGTRMIPQKKHARRRLAFFIRTTKWLKKRGKSLVVSAEGVREYIHGIQPFNKGIFHMAMEAGLPLVLLYIHIPEQINPYKGKASKSGRIHLEILGEVDNSNWKLENIWDEIAKVRKIYVDRFNELNNTQVT